MSGTQRVFLAVFIGIAVGFTPVLAFAEATSAQTTNAESAAESTAGLDRLRAAVQDAYNRRDIDSMASYLHPEVVIVFPDGSIIKGRDAFRQYYDRMLNAPNHRVMSFSADPVVESRTVHNDVGLSYGYMNDKYVLNDGQSFALNSRFTVTVFKSPDGPVETGGWMIRSFHSSADTFDNPILAMVGRAVFLRAGIGGLVIGTLLGLLLGALLFRRRKKATVSEAKTQE